MKLKLLINTEMANTMEILGLNHQSQSFILLKNVNITAKLISAFVFATRIVQSLYFIYTKFQASSYLLSPYSPVYVGPGRKPRRPVFSERGSILNSAELSTKKFNNFRPS